MLGIGTQADGRTEFTHEGVRYIMKLAPSRLSLRCGFRVAAALAPVMGVVAKQRTPEGIFAAAMSYLFQNPATEENVLYLVDAFAPYTEVIIDAANPPITFTLSTKIDDHFAGHQDVLMDWLGRAIEQNLRSFLPGLLAQQARLGSALEELGVTAKKSSSSPNPAEKSGSSGA